MKRQNLIISYYLVICGLLVFTSFFNSNKIFAQGIAINNIGAFADTSAGLDINYTDKGLLIPRVSLTSATDVTTILSPAVSLMVYNTATAGTSPNNVEPGFYYWNGTLWIKIAPGITGATGATGSTGTQGIAGPTGNTGTATGVNSTGLHFVGEPYNGGIIFYVDASGEHGLIISATNYSGGYVTWGCSGTNISGTGTAIGTGAANTTAIDNVCTTTTIPAHFCENLNRTGYSDWYLPSKDELNQVYINRDAITGLNPNNYWSSSQINSTTAWSQNMANGVQNSDAKNNNAYARCIRSF